MVSPTDREFPVLKDCDPGLDAPDLFVFGGLHKDRFTSTDPCQGTDKDAVGFERQMNRGAGSVILRPSRILRRRPHLHDQR
ncbi:hypothetical protein ACFZDK_28305 [Streptomyces sp. NPDC007901]|uniref:hypothetical protein n=1 Tax=Streptomyces sp. NPDC007901 TaxID=3364785 RepID=UPI0036F0C4BB